VNIRIAGVVKESIVDGPGIRYVLFTQGCPHRCKGCHNPQTHDFNGGKIVSTEDIVEDILSKVKYIDGITISGGEPLVQPEACIEIIKAVKKAGLHVIVYTGFTWEYMWSKGSGEQQLVVRMADAVVDGPFIEQLKSYNIKFRGSTNQRFIDVKASIALGKVVEVNLGDAVELERRAAVV